MSTVRLEAVKMDDAAQEIPMQPASAGHLGQEVPPEDEVGRGDRCRHRRHLPARRQGARRSRRRAGEAEVLARAFRVGAAPRGDPRRPHHVQRRRPGTQAGDLDDQLHRLGHDRRLDGRHPGEGPRSGPDAEGRLRHRLRILDAAPARRVRRRRRCVHLRPDVLHGYLRQDVFHRLLGRWPPRRADGHLRRLASRREGLHPRQARRRPPAPVQPLAADHRRLHGSGGRRQRLAARVPDQHQGTGRHRPGRRQHGRLARLADAQELRRARRRPGGLPHLRPHPRAAPVGHDHGLDVRLRRAGLHPDRPRQRDEQQLVVREHPRDQPLRRAAAAALRRVPAGLGQPHQVRAQPLHRPGGVRLGGIQGSRARVHPHARQRGRSERPAAAAAARRDHAQAPPRHGLPGPGQHDDDAAHEVRLARIVRVHRPHRPRHGRGRLGNGPDAWPRKRAPRRSWKSASRSPPRCCASARKW